MRPGALRINHRVDSNFSAESPVSSLDAIITQQLVRHCRFALDSLKPQHTISHRQDHITWIDARQLHPHHNGTGGLAKIDVWSPGSHGQAIKEPFRVKQQVIPYRGHSFIRRFSELGHLFYSCLKPPRTREDATALDLLLEKLVDLGHEFRDVLKFEVH
jgi:hypothetical protein